MFADLADAEMSAVSARTDDNATALWRRLSIGDGVELHVATDVRMPSEPQMEFFTQWVRTHFTPAMTRPTSDNLPREPRMPTAAHVESTLDGLLAPDHTLIPLVGVSVEASISECLADVTIAQRYRNDESQPIEAVYVFPLDESATVRAFEATVGATRFVAEVMDRDEAFRVYDEAMERGDGAYLLDRERADVFTVSVGQVPPGAEVY